MSRHFTSAVVLAAGILCAGAAAGVPVIPHPVDGYAVTQEKNDCLMCHRKAAGEQPQNGEIPASHYEGDKLQAARQQCTMCHQVEKK